jgi:hypothetical protein
MIIQGPKSWFNVIHYKLNEKHTTAENLKLAEAVFKNTIQNIHLNTILLTKSTIKSLPMSNVQAHLPRYLPG